jgi:hypothetical protein
VPSYQPGKPETMLKLAEVYGVDVKAIRDGLKNATNPRSKNSIAGKTARRRRPHTQ